MCTGYTAAGLISLGTQASSVLPPGAFNANPNFADGKFERGSVPETCDILASQRLICPFSRTGEVVKIMGIISGAFVLLFSFWFFCISTVSVIAGIKEMQFSLNWYGMVFPNAGLTLAVIQLGSAFSSPAINGVASALTVLLVIAWFIATSAHVRAVWKGDIMWPGKDEDKDMKGIRWGRYAA